MELWIARDLDGSLFLYSEKPQRGKYSFWTEHNGTISLGNKEFPYVTWENSPLPAELTLA